MVEPDPAGLVLPSRHAYHGGWRGARRSRSGGPPSSVWLPRNPLGPTVSVDDSPLTRQSLLLQLRDGANHDAWREFMQLYGPVVYGFARRRGLQDADAADLMQDVMRSVSGAIGRLEYDRSQGTFRGWLFTITRNKVFNFLSARRIRPQGSAGDSATNRLLNASRTARAIRTSGYLEYQRRLASLAMDRIKGEHFQDRTWQAFWLTAVEGVAAAEAAKRGGMSPGAVSWPKAGCCAPEARSRIAATAGRSLR